MKRKRKPLETIESHGYRVDIYTKNRVVVTDLKGGRLSKPVTVTELLSGGDSNPKLAKNAGYAITWGLSLASHTKAGIGNVCAFANGCEKPCLDNQGRGGSATVSNARIARTVLFYLARDWFFAKLEREIQRHIDENENETLGIRLNMFSDIPWEHYGIIDKFTSVTFWDYTKNPRRAGWLRDNYHVTFSYDGKNGDHALRILEAGNNVSVVFYDETPGPKTGRYAHEQTLPDQWKGFSVIDGGKTDWRPSDPQGVVVGLRLLAKTWQSRNEAIASGFAQLVSDGVAIDEDSLEYWIIGGEV